MVGAEPGVVEVNLARPPWCSFVISARRRRNGERVSWQSKVFALRQRGRFFGVAGVLSVIGRCGLMDQVPRVSASSLVGMVSLRPLGGGHTRRIDDDTREAIRAIALARPCDLGEPATTWSTSACASPLRQG